MFSTQRPPPSLDRVSGVTVTRVSGLCFSSVSVSCDPCFSSAGAGPHQLGARLAESLRPAQRARRPDLRGRPVRPAQDQPKPRPGGRQDRLRLIRPRRQTRSVSVSQSVSLSPAQCMATQLWPARGLHGRAGAVVRHSRSHCGSQPRPVLSPRRSAVLSTVRPSVSPQSVSQPVSQSVSQAPPGQSATSVMNELSRWTARNRVRHRQRHVSVNVHLLKCSRAKRNARKRSERRQPRPLLAVNTNISSDGVGKR